MSTDGQAIVLASGKGGVGKTGLAVNLGIQLARRGAHPILLDADCRLADAEILANISPRRVTGDLPDASSPLADQLAETPEGLRIASGCSELCQRNETTATHRQRCNRVLRRLNAECDILLVDCGSGLSELVAALALHCDRFLLVTTPEPTAIADCYRTLKYVYRRGFCAPVGVIVNMARNQREAARVAGRLQRVAAQFLGLTLGECGYVPRDSHVIRAVRQRTPVVARYPACRASICIDSICERISPRPNPVGALGGLWGRVASLVL